MKTLQSKYVDRRGDTPPRDDVCPRCWGYTFHRDECAYSGMRIDPKTKLLRPLSERGL